jgi:transcriptional regulator with XRE-family HTH domain
MQPYDIERYYLSQGFMGGETKMIDQEQRLEIKARIVRSGRHQYEVARELGVGEQHFSGFLCGVRKLSPDRLQRLHELLGMTLVGVD